MEGQLWSYDAPRNYERSRLLILKVEVLNQEEIVHVTVTGDGINAPAHMPFSTHAVRRSVVDLVESSWPLPDFSEGYALCRAAFEAGKAGVYGITVGEALQL